MSDRQSFASLDWSRKGKVTRRERFLAEMDAEIPWSELMTLIEPNYPKGETGRPPQDLERMLRIYFLRPQFDLSDPEGEDAICDSESMRRFAKVELFLETIPDETTILRFRHLLENHKQTKNGKTWHFGMKFYIGKDRRGTVHSLTATHAAVPDREELPKRLDGYETVLGGDQAYWKQAYREAFEAKGARYRVNRRGPRGNKSHTAYQKRINRTRSRMRARREHPLRVVNQLWGFTKTRYRGIEKSMARAYTMFALAILFALRHRLMPRRRNYAL